MKQINLKQNFNKLKNKLWIIPTSLIMMQSKVFAAQGSIGTAKVNQANKNMMMYTIIYFIVRDNKTKKYLLIGIKKVLYLVTSRNKL